MSAALRRVFSSSALPKNVMARKCVPPSSKRRTSKKGARIESSSLCRMSTAATRTRNQFCNRWFSMCVARFEYCATLPRPLFTPSDGRGALGLTEPTENRDRISCPPQVSCPVAPAAVEGHDILSLHEAERRPHDALTNKGVLFGAAVPPRIRGCAWIRFAKSDSRDGARENVWINPPPQRRHYGKSSASRI